MSPKKESMLTLTLDFLENEEEEEEEEEKENDVMNIDVIEPSRHRVISRQTRYAFRQSVANAAAGVGNYVGATLQALGNAAQSAYASFLYQPPPPIDQQPLTEEERSAIIEESRQYLRDHGSYTSPQYSIFPPPRPIQNSPSIYEDPLNRRQMNLWVDTIREPRAQPLGAEYGAHLVQLIDVGARVLTGRRQSVPEAIADAPIILETMALEYDNFTAEEKDEIQSVIEAMPGSPSSPPEALQEAAEIARRLIPRRPKPDRDIKIFATKMNRKYGPQHEPAPPRNPTPQPRPRKRNPNSDIKSYGRRKTKK